MQADFVLQLMFWYYPERRRLLRIKSRNLSLQNTGKPKDCCELFGEQR